MTEAPKKIDRFFVPRITLGEIMLIIGLTTGLFSFALGERDREAKMRSQIAVLAVEVQQVKEQVGELKVWVRRLGDKIDIRLGARQ